MPDVRTIIFDLDGTLIDSAPDLHAAMNVALAALSRPALDLSDTVSFVGNGVEKLVERSLIATGGCDPASYSEALTRFLAAYEADSATLTRPYPGVEDCLRRLQASGYGLGICTNKPDGPAKDICTALGLGGYFMAVHGARDGQPKKPDPKALLSCIEDMGGVASTTLFVGDSLVDYETALNAKIPFALFSGGYLNGAITGPAPAITFDNWAKVDLLGF